MSRRFHDFTFENRIDLEICIIFLKIHQVFPDKFFIIYITDFVYIEDQLISQLTLKYFIFDFFFRNIIYQNIKSSLQAIRTDFLPFHLPGIKSHHIISLELFFHVDPLSLLIPKLITILRYFIIEIARASCREIVWHTWR